MNLAQTGVVDTVLTTQARGYRNAEFVGNLLFPAVDVTQSSGKVIEFGKEAFQLYNARRAPGAKTKRIEFGYEGKPYALVQDTPVAIYCSRGPQLGDGSYLDLNRTPSREVGRKIQGQLIAIFERHRALIRSTPTPLDELASAASQEGEISSQPPATEGKPHSSSDVP